MHHRITIKLGTNFHYDEAAYRSQDPGLYLKCQGHTRRSDRVLFDWTVPCQAHISTMHHRIPKLLGTHVQYHKVACHVQDPGLYLKCQGHT